MANKKISQLDAASAAANMVIPASDAAGTVTNKVTVQSILNLAEDTALRALFLPPAPTSVAGLPGTEQVILTWTAPSATYIPPITDYAVQYSANSGSTWTTISDGVLTSTGTTVLGLTNGQGYVFRCAAINGVGQGAWSAASETVTPSEPVTQYSVSSASANVGTYGNNPVLKLYDDNLSTYFQSSQGGVFPVIVTFDLGSPQTVLMYRLYGGLGGSFNAPSVWTLEASTDSSSWTVIDTRSGANVGNSVYHSFNVAIPGAYRYYRLNITALYDGANCAIGEWQVWGA